jgi:hypothetical protein
VGYSIRTLSARVAELRPIYVPPHPASRTSYLAGEIAQCDFWIPPITLPAGYGQTCTATQLQVLTMITGHARCGLSRVFRTAVLCYFMLPAAGLGIRCGPAGGPVAR